MRIEDFTIRNFRNIRYASCENVPDFMVICGGNGCGKTALLEALMTAKERAGAYGNFKFDPRVVSANSQKSEIKLRIKFSKDEIDFIRKTFNENCPEFDDIVLEIFKDGSAKTIKRSRPASRVLGYFSRKLGSPGFFDYINAYRKANKTTLQTWDASFLSDERAKQTLADSDQKFELTKTYLISLKMHDLQKIQSTGKPLEKDSLNDIRVFFNSFFSPMSFVDVYIDRSPFEFVISTPNGLIDIDDLSAGEKEIFNIYLRFHQLKPNNSVILFDEADAHLHPDLERRYLILLKDLGENNQVILTTHSPEMMIEAGNESLYTILKYPNVNEDNQLIKVSNDEKRHQILSELMGSRGIISFNQKIIFIEGEESSIDRQIYEHFYPPGQYNISFVPAGNSTQVKRVSEYVNLLLSSSTNFQEYYSIVDKDMNRLDLENTELTRLFFLPVYHIENFLLDSEVIYSVTRRFLGDQSPMSSSFQVEENLKELLFSDTHLNPFARAILDKNLSVIAKGAYDSVFRREISFQPQAVSFEECLNETEGILRESVTNESWKKICKGRNLLKTYCQNLNINYIHFRNSILSNMNSPPQELTEIMNSILN